MRLGEQISINLLKGINKFGILGSLKPLLVKDLAMKMINVALLTHFEGVTIYRSKDLFS